MLDDTYRALKNKFKTTNVVVLLLFVLFGFFCNFSEQNIMTETSGHNKPRSLDLTQRSITQQQRMSVYLHQIRSVLVYERAESQSAPERRGHVADGHVPVALAVHAAPLLQSLDGSHPPRALRRQMRPRRDTRGCPPRARRSRVTIRRVRLRP